ncbi:putative motility protein [Thauera sp. Sel9]|uniref:putative motility protein n=1 Tax=Thauera sp. Sel9 TaxID=2974299 RepID=UPI0021E12FA5|nr:putative motility protein [Thauera sp. Sel9]MCV2217918.1 putative motility protein [Thauera sp. Sel9]
MDVSSIAAAASANAAARVQAEASVKVLKMALDMQAESALQLLQAVPAPAQPPASAVGSAAGGVVDTWA